MAYKDLVPVGTALVISATSFGLGAIYAQLPYDLNTLWIHDVTGKAFETSLAHYNQWANAPQFVHHILHFVMGLGFIGSFIKLYKPQEESKFFEYGSLGLFMVGVVIYLTNLRIGINSAYSGDWGEVDAATGLNVVAASQVMIVIALVGVLVLQGGLYYAEWYDEKVKVEFLKKEAEEEAVRSEKEAEPTAVSSGVEKKKGGKKRV